MSDSLLIFPLALGPARMRVHIREGHTPHDKGVLLVLSRAFTSWDGQGWADLGLEIK